MRADRLRREDIVASAAALFAARGYQGVSMSELAEQVGVRKASLFHHFRRKEDLYASVLESLVGQLADVVAVAQTEEGSFLDRLDRLGSTLTELLGRQPFAARLLVREAMDNGPVMQGSLGDSMQAVLASATAFTREGQRTGEVERSLDAREVVASLVGLHFLPFALDHVTARFVAASPFDAEYIEHRTRQVLQQSRALVRPRA